MPKGLDISVLSEQKGQLTDFTKILIKGLVEYVTSSHGYLSLTTMSHLPHKSPSSSPVSSESSLADSFELFFFSVNLLT
jgi:hypothetical protein